MDSASSPSLPSVFDPALEDHWEELVNPVILPSSTNSDDFEALHLVRQESTAAKNKEGVVIQHRAWPLAEVFRSEADRVDGKTDCEFISASHLLNKLPRNAITIEVPLSQLNTASVLSTVSQNACGLFPRSIPIQLPSASRKTFIACRIEHPETESHKWLSHRRRFRWR
jgi:chromosome transmission fidelity protein 18